VARQIAGLASMAAWSAVETPSSEKARALRPSRIGFTARERHRSGDGLAEAVGPLGIGSGVGQRVQAILVAVAAGVVEDLFTGRGLAWSIGPRMSAGHFGAGVCGSALRAGAGSRSAGSIHRFWDRTPRHPRACPMLRSRMELVLPS